VRRSSDLALAIAVIALFVVMLSPAARTATAPKFFPDK
jgi:hypothetical protein